MHTMTETESADAHRWDAFVPPDATDEQAQTLRQLAQLTDQIEQLRKRSLPDLIKTRKELVKRGRDALGIRPGDLARATGLGRDQVRRLAAGISSGRTGR
jgi:hypothetical protein